MKTIILFSTTNTLNALDVLISNIDEMVEWEEKTVTVMKKV